MKKLLATFSLLILPITVLAANPAPSAFVVDKVNNFINRVAWPAFFAAVVVVFLWIGFLYLKGQGDQGATATANQAVLWAVIGIIVALLGFSALNIINSIISGGGVNNNPGNSSGACCLPNNTCDQAVSDWCTSQGGTFMNEGSVCTPNSCGGNQNQNTVACCGGSGSSICANVSAVECSGNPGWVPQAAGTSCATFDCSTVGQAEQQTGACCFASNGACGEYSGSVCQASNGNYRGDDTSCTPNPCPQP